MEHLVPGIFYPLFHNGWNDVVEEKLIAKHYRVTKHEHFTMPLTRWLLMWYRARQLAKNINEQDDYFVRGWGHSNGCELWSMAMPHLAKPINELHLFAGACSADFNKNNFNWALKNNKVNDIIVHVSDNDTVLSGPAKFSRIGGAIGLGFGDIGLVGPKNVDQSIAHRVHPIHHTGYYHSTYWNDEVIDKTILDVINQSWR